MAMKEEIRSIPRPLVQTNQWFIVICVAATWISGRAWILLFPLLAGLMGLMLQFNPVMRFAKLFLRKPPSAYIPEDWDQQQFNQKIAVGCLGAGFISYWAHWMIAAYIFTAMVAIAAFVAILGFCIGCFIRYQWMQYRYRKASKQS